jgi:hypothetical protein
MATEWPPRAGELWMATTRWPGTEFEPPVNGGEMVVVLWGEQKRTVEGYPWWCGEVIGPAGKRFIKAVRDDLIPADDPRLGAPEFNRGL